MLNKLLLLIIIIFSNIAFAKDITSHNNVAGITPLMNAVMNNDIDGVKFFATKEQDLIDKQNIGGATALHLAARHNNTEFTQILLENKAKLNIKDDEGWTPIMRAAADCKTENAMMLINAGANIFFYNNNDESAILYATNSKCLKLVTKFKEETLLKYSFLKLKLFKQNIQKSIYIASRMEDAKIKDELEQILSHLNNLYEAKERKISKKKSFSSKKSDSSSIKLESSKIEEADIKEDDIPVVNVDSKKEQKKQRKFKFKKSNDKPKIISETKIKEDNQNKVKPLFQEKIKKVEKSDDLNKKKIKKQKKFTFKKKADPKIEKKQKKYTFKKKTGPKIEKKTEKKKFSFKKKIDNKVKKDLLQKKFKFKKND